MSFLLLIAFAVATTLPCVALFFVDGPERARLQGA
jgi:hypothetical protein